MPASRLWGVRPVARTRPVLFRPPRARYLRTRLRIIRMLSSGFHLSPGRATMLETIFRRRHHIRRLRANPIGSILDPYVGYLIGRGHTTNVVHQFVRAAEHYGHWLGTRHGVVTADHLTRASARLFLHEHLAACSCLVPLPRDLINGRAAIGHLLRMLDGQDPARRSAPPTPHDSLLGEYDRFLRQTCGLSGHTRGYRL